MTRLDYEAYAEMAERKIEEILLECIERHGLAAAAASTASDPFRWGSPA